MPDERKLVTLDDIERRLIQDHGTAYYAWVRQVVTLCAGTLALLVSLQKSYIPKDPTLLFLLKLSWASFAASVGLGIVVLHGEHQTPLDARNALRRRRNQQGDPAAVAWLENGHGHTPKQIYLTSYRLLLWTVGLAFCLLVLFALLNSPAPQ